MTLYFYITQASKHADNQLKDPHCDSLCQEFSEQIGDRMTF